MNCDRTILNKWEVVNLFDIDLNSLTQIVDVRVLQEVQDKFATATGLGVVIADKEGNSLTKPSCFSNLCQLIRAASRGHLQCQFSDAVLGAKGHETHEPMMAPCHAGLYDLAAPIVVHEVFLGSVLCGQVLMNEPDDLWKRNLAAYLHDLNVDVDDDMLTDLVRQITVTTPERFRASADLLQIMAQYIVSIGVASLDQKLLHEKHLSLMQEEAARMQLERDLKSMELKALQSQVNPHFLFNTLNTIVRLAMLEGAEQTMKVSYALSHLLRYILRRIDQPVTLEDEVAHINEYLVIQEFRYGERLKSSINISEGARHFRLPLMTLQPIVENALIHGLESKVEGGTVKITAQEIDQGYQIVIEDDGVGMSPERLKEITELPAKRTGNSHTTGIGLGNVVARLQQFFDGNFSYEVSSRLGLGTKVILNFYL